LWQNISITPCEALVHMILDTGCSILEKGDTPYLIQHRVSGIEYLALYGLNVNANDIFIFGSGFVRLSFIFPDYGD